MAIWQSRDGELRIYDHGNSGTTHYLEILFTDANLSGPTGRPRTEEILYTDRGNVNNRAGYREGPAAVRLEPLPLTFTCRTANTKNSRILVDWLSGVTTITATAANKTLYTRKGERGTATSGISVAMPTFKDSGKNAYMVESFWSGSGVSNLGYRWDEVYFPPSEQTIAESEEALTLNLSGQVYGGVSRVKAFHTGATDIGTL